MAKVFFIIIFSLVIVKGHTQTERVYLHLDKYSCRPGDTVWFKGYLFKDQFPTSLSTNLYVELFTEQGELLSRNIFPIAGSVSIGQLIIPDSLITNNYYLRAFTRYQLNYDTANLFSVPILVYNKDKPNPVFHKKEIVYPNTVVYGLINGIEWSTGTYKEQLSSLLSIDRGSKTRNLRLVKFSNSDSIFIADIILNSDEFQKYILLPLDTTSAQDYLLLYEDNRLIGRQCLQLKNSSNLIKLNPDTLNTDPFGYNSWQINIADTLMYATSISVTDADRSIIPPTTIARLKNSYTTNLVTPVKQIDTSFITFTGTATKESGKKIKDPFAKDLLVAGVKDSAFVFVKVVHTDSAGHFTLDSLFFFDDIEMQFQINKIDDVNTKNIRLNLTKFVPPGADNSFFRKDWEDDIKPISREDTFFTRSELSKHELSKMKTLKPVLVKGWKNHRRELDDKYTRGAFSEPALYSFDVRTERRFRDLGSFLRMNFPRFQGGYSSFDTPKDAMHHPLLFFVDEMNYTWSELAMFDWERIAYIKCFENDFIGDDNFIKWKNGMSTGFSMSGDQALKVSASATPMIIAIYTRKGTDYRTMPGGLNKISVKGYSSVLKFNPDRVSLFWDPFEFDNSFRIRFYNNEETKRFRIVVEGVNHKGEIVHLEKMIQ